MRRLLRLVGTIKGGLDWYLLLAGVGVVPPASVVIAALAQVPPHLVGPWVLAGVAYFLVIYVEGVPLLTRRRLTTLLQQGEAIRRIEDYASQAGAIDRWRRLRWLPPDVREPILAGTAVAGTDLISVPMERIRVLLGRT